jgi:molybdopterin converting factor subunit 1
MKVNVKLFGHYRDIAGDDLTLELPEGSTVRSAAQALVGGNDRLKLLETHCRAAVNYDYSPSETILHDGDEVAFIPPMSGG